MLSNILCKMLSKIGLIPCVTECVTNKKDKNRGLGINNFWNSQGAILCKTLEKTASKVDKSYVKYLQTGGTHMKSPNNKGAM